MNTLAEKMSLALKDLKLILEAALSVEVMFSNLLPFFKCIDFMKYVLMPNSWNLVKLYLTQLDTHKITAKIMEIQINLTAPNMHFWLKDGKTDWPKSQIFFREVFKSLKANPPLLSYHFRAPWGPFENCLKGK